MTGSGAAVRPVTVVIVDDHDGFRAAARALLEAAGFEVVAEASDGESARRCVARLRPRLVLLDVVLPGADGFAVCADLVADEPAPIVVLTSTRPAATFRRRLAGSRACGFIPKSELSGETLAAMIATA